MMDQNIDSKKKDAIIVRLLQMETDNIVKEVSTSEMVDKIKKMIINEVEKK